jgi:hypothetical protein
LIHTLFPGRVRIKEAIMNVKTCLIILALLVPALPLTVSGNKKKGDLERGMLEKMEAVPCGAKQRGLAGLGSLWASVGITHVNSDEKLCPQYLLRSDQMDYQIRPLNLKHATILPVGTEGEFKITKKEMLLTMPEGGDRKTRAYEVVAMTPNNNDNNSSGEGAEKSSSSLSSQDH